MKEPKEIVVHVVVDRYEPSEEDRRHNAVIEEMYEHEEQQRRDQADYDRESQNVWY